MSNERLPDRVSPDRAALIASLAPPTGVGIEDVRRAAARLDGVAHRTPVMTSRSIDALLGARVFFKCENFQRVGAFKFRGAYNALKRGLETSDRRLDGEEERDGDGSGATTEGGVLAWSSGNHAQAVALAGRLLGVQTVIVMPRDAPAVKMAATRGYLDSKKGSEVVPYDRGVQSREVVGSLLAKERGLRIVPPYDDPDVIAGQGTVGLELFEEVGELDYLFVCVGGGGLISGCGISARALSPGCRVVGVEPEAGDDATRSFASGSIQSVHDPQTIADGARTESLGRYTFPLVMRNVDAMMTVSDAELVRAMRLVWERMKIVIEPTGALGLAGALKRSGELEGKRVGVVVSGGNVDLDALGEIWGLG